MRSTSATRNLSDREQQQILLFCNYVRLLIFPSLEVALTTFFFHFKCSHVDLIQIFFKLFLEKKSDGLKKRSLIEQKYG